MNCLIMFEVRAAGKLSAIDVEHRRKGGIYWLFSIERPNGAIKLFGHPGLRYKLDCVIGDSDRR
jgi:hypothetical protein